MAGIEAGAGAERPLRGMLLANAPNGWLQTLAFLVSGGLGLAWAAGMGRVLGVTGAERRLVWRLLALQSILALLFAVVPTDPGARATSLVGVLHLANFGVYAVSMPVTLLLIARIMARDPRWVGWASPTRGAGVVALVSMALVPLTLYGRLLPWLGLLERIYVAIPTVWEAAVLMAALRRISGASGKR